MTNYVGIYFEVKICLNTEQRNNVKIDQNQRNKTHISQEQHRAATFLSSNFDHKTPTGNCRPIDQTPIKDNVWTDSKYVS